jgi:hypothetical protein
MTGCSVLGTGMKLQLVLLAHCVEEAWVMLELDWTS